MIENSENKLLIRRELIKSEETLYNYNSIIELFLN